MALYFEDLEKLRDVFQEEENDAGRRRQQKAREEIQRRKLELAERKLELAEHKQRQAEEKEQQTQPEKPANSSTWLWVFITFFSLVTDFIIFLVILTKY